MHHPSRILACAVAALGLGLSACGGGNEQTGEGRVSVVATTSQMADIAREVAGDRARVTGLVAPGADPHDYEPTPRDAAAVAEADLVVESGAGIDAWIDDVVRTGGGSPRRLDVSRGVTLLPGDEESPDGDPHHWLDPDNARWAARAIGEALAGEDPGAARAHRAAAAAYAARIADLDAELRALIATVPRERRLLVTNHDALGYFARHYGITVLGTAIPSLSTAAEPDAKALRELTAAIRSAGVRTVFAEDSVEPRLERAIARESGATVGPGLFADTLGPPDGPAGTYLGMMRTNMERIVSGLSA